MAIWLEDRIPAEHILATRRDDLAIAASSEDDWLGIWTFAESKDALSIRSLVIKVLDHLPETLTADTSQEILTETSKQSELALQSRWVGDILTCRVLGDHCMH